MTPQEHFEGFMGSLTTLSPWDLRIAYTVATSGVFSARRALRAKVVMALSEGMTSLEAIQTYTGNPLKKSVLEGLLCDIGQLGVVRAVFDNTALPPDRSILSPLGDTSFPGVSNKVKIVWFSAAGFPPDATDTVLGLMSRTSERLLRKLSGLAPEEQHRVVFDITDQGYLSSRPQVVFQDPPTVQVQEPVPNAHQLRVEEEEKLGNERRLAMQRELAAQDWVEKNWLAPRMRAFLERSPSARRANLDVILAQRPCLVPDFSDTIVLLASSTLPIHEDKTAELLTTYRSGWVAFTKGTVNETVNREHTARFAVLSATQGENTAHWEWALKVPRGEKMYLRGFACQFHNQVSGNIPKFSTYWVASAEGVSAITKEDFNQAEAVFRSQPV